MAPEADKLHRATERHLRDLTTEQYLLDPLSQCLEVAEIRLRTMLELSRIVPGRVMVFVIRILAIEAMSIEQAPTSRNKRRSERSGRLLGYQRANRQIFASHEYPALLRPGGTVPAHRMKIRLCAAKP